MLKLDLKEKRFETNVVLRDIALALGPGDRMALLGPSGIGKTTLLRVLSGLDTRFTGTCARPARIALMFQNPNLLLWRSVAQNLSVFHPSASEAEIDKALDQVGLLDKRALFPGQLSVGQQRRLALARTFLGGADLVLLDEPFTSLDPALRSEMVALTQRLLTRFNSALVLVTHAKEEATLLSARPFQLSRHASGAGLSEI